MTRINTRRVTACFLVIAIFMIIIGVPLHAQSNNTRTPIKHVIIIMLENHSFDNIYGVYPTGNGTVSSPVARELEAPINLLGRINPAQLMPVPRGEYWTANPDEGYDEYHTDWNHGLMNGFIQGSGIQSMYYFTQYQVAIEWDWAEEYGIGDMYFSSYLSETNPNRLMSLAGYTPVTADYGPPPYIPVNESIFGELSHYNVSWGYYLLDPSPSDFPLDYFEGISAYSSNIRSWSQFYEELTNGGLPSVCWVMATGGGASGLDQHPPSNMTAGELWVLRIVDAVMASRYWNNTVIFITYDEGGGYYDQVPPPVLDGVQLGFRVPLIVISPYAKENYVSNTVLNHASLLAFIDYNWRLPALNQFVADSNIPLDFFDFNQTYPGGYLIRPPLILGNDTGYPIIPQIPFSELPYARNGSSSVTLASMDVSLYVFRDVSYTPLYRSNYFDFTILALLIVLLAAAYRYIGRRQRGNG